MTHTEDLKEVIKKLSRKIPTHLAILLTTGGNVVWVEGADDGIDVISLSSLIAGEFLANQKIAHMIGDMETYDICIREGPRMNVLIANAGESLLLFALVETEVPLGWARMQVKETCSQLSRYQIASSLIGPYGDVGDLRVAMNDELSDALEALWIK